MHYVLGNVALALFLVLAGSDNTLFGGSGGGANPFPAAVCSEDGGGCLSGTLSTLVPPAIPLNAACKCSKHAFCYLGTCLCHPGYDPASKCTRKLLQLNPWLAKGCSNLHRNNTFSANLTLVQIGAEFHRGGSLCPKFLKSCAAICFAHYTYGIVAVPQSLWLNAQRAESALWKSLGGLASDTSANDRAEEHWDAFGRLSCLPQGFRLGSVVEVGAGPWTQIKGFLFIRPDLQLDHLTVVEPSADSYMKSVRSCSYRSGNSLAMWSGSGQHSFPVTVVSMGGEAVSSLEQYNTLVSINVLEHVQNALEYLTNIYLAIKPGGTLIFHERYYPNSQIMDVDEYHPVRIKRKVLDRFLAGFHIIYNNCSALYGSRGKGEMGYYVIARKL